MKKIMLPMGTIVELKKGKGKLMITGYGLKNTNDGKYYDYSSAIFPLGFNPNELILFNEEDIKEIYYLGYQEPMAIKFRTEMTTFMKDVKSGVNPEEAAKRMNERLGVK